jgi:hypothetical protein
MARRGYLFTNFEVSFTEHGPKFGRYFFHCPECGRCVYTSGYGVLFRCDPMGPEYVVKGDVPGEDPNGGAMPLLCPRSVTSQSPIGSTKKE